MSVEKMHAHLRSFSHRFIVKDPIVKHSMRVQRAFNNARGLPTRPTADRSHENAVLAVWSQSRHLHIQQKLSKKDKICQNTGTSTWTEVPFPFCSVARNQVSATQRIEVLWKSRWFQSEEETELIFTHRFDISPIILWSNSIFGKILASWGR
jgi:hypothetical protein